MTARLVPIAALPGACGVTGCPCALLAVCPAAHCRAIVEDVRMVMHHGTAALSEALGESDSAAGIIRFTEARRALIVDAAAAMRRHFTATHCDDCVRQFDDAHEHALAKYDQRHGTTPTHAGDDGGSGS